MRIYPDDKSCYDEEDVKELNAEDWQLELLKKNPEYISWGNYEDYMAKDGQSWDSRQFYDRWIEFIQAWNDMPNELNEFVNFYFEVYRESKRCGKCDGCGFNPETKHIYENFYSFDGGEGWSENLNDEDVKVLADYRDLSMEEARERANGKGLGMDALDRYELVEQRAKRRNVFGHCEHCDGDGVNYIDDKAKVGLQLWVLHPRKGCSRGVYIKQIEQEDIPEVIEFLKESKERNEKRFSRLEK